MLSGRKRHADTSNAHDRIGIMMVAPSISQTLESITCLHGDESSTSPLKVLLAKGVVVVAMANAFCAVL